MQTIRAGDLYFLESPIHTTDQNAEAEKTLAYLLGTISARPAVVVRPPAWWDQFDTVTVIPALTKGSPAYVCRLYDRHGNLTKATYPFIPHQPFTVPVCRLGRHIGSMDQQELEELMYAFHWIHDPFARYDKSRPVPKIYQQVVHNQCPPDKWRSGDPRCNPEIYLDKSNGRIASVTHPEVNGLQVTDFNNRNNGEVKYPTIVEDIDRTSTYESGMKTFTINSPADNTRVPDFIPVTEENLPIVSESCESIAVPVEKRFPPSCFDLDTLERIAGRFTFSDAYYTHGVVKRDIDILAFGETERLRLGLSKFQYDQVLEVYDKFEPMDALILGPRLPTAVLAENTKLTIEEATVLKRICNYLRDIPDSIYQDRLKTLEQKRAYQKGLLTQKSQGAAVVVSVDDMRAKLDKVKPYMNAKKIMFMPNTISALFLELPRYQLQKIWNGPQFDKKYQDAVSKYSKRR